MSFRLSRVIRSLSLPEPLACRLAAAVKWESNHRLPSSMLSLVFFARIGENRETLALCVRGIAYRLLGCRSFSSLG